MENGKCKEAASGHLPFAICHLPFAIIMSAIIPIPHHDLSIRAATMADIPFMDGLQKKYGKALGYFPTKQFEGYVQSGGVLVAERT
jgi:hypothetical protein